MYIHIAIFRWKSAASLNEVETALNGIKMLESKIEGIESIRWGRNESKRSEGYTHVVVVTANSKDAIQAYRVHPDHVKWATVIDRAEEHGIGIDFDPGSKQ